jgi:hypothetical protein
MTRVTLSREVVVSLGEGTGAAIRGAGRSVGFVLVGATPVDGDIPLYAQIRLGLCGRASCTPTEDETAEITVYDGDYDLEQQTLRLPRGDYLLYLVADRAPATVTFRLPGLPGTARLRPRGVAEGGVTEPAVAIHESQTHTVYSNGDVFDMKGRGSLSLNALRVRADAWVGGQAATCLYDEAPPAAPLGFAPGCPLGQNTLVTDTLITPIPRTRIYISAAERDGPGVLGHGSWLASAAAVSEIDAVGFHLDFVGVR